MALSYGKAHLKCPYCNDKKKFCDEALNQGIYIPEKDASWENPDEESFYNFQAMGQLYSICDAKPCACTKGPKFNLAGSRFEVSLDYFFQFIDQVLFQCERRMPCLQKFAILQSWTFA